MADNYRHKYNNMSQIFFPLYIIRHNVDRIDLEWSIIYNKNTHNPPLEGIREVLILTGIQDENADFLRQSALIICNYELFGKVFQGRMVRAGTADVASNPFSFLRSFNYSLSNISSAHWLAVLAKLFSQQQPSKCSPTIFHCVTARLYTSSVRVHVRLCKLCFRCVFSSIITKDICPPRPQLHLCQQKTNK